MSAESIPTLQAAMLQSNLAQNERIVLRATVVKIGRAVTEPHDITIRADDIQASREHAIFTLENGVWYVEDTSRNGTIINGKVINKQKVPLGANDRVQVGGSFDATFKLLGATIESTQLSTNGHTPSEAKVVIPPPMPPPAEPVPPRNNGIWISPSAAIWRDGQRLPISLSRTEYRLLKYLSHHIGDVCEYEDVIQAVWGGMRDKDSLHELIYRVRRKIEPNPSAPKFLIIRSGIGVVFFPNGVNQKD